QPRQLVTDLVGDLHVVALGGRGDHQAEAGLAVGAGDRGRLGVVEGDLGDVAELLRLRCRPAAAGRGRGEVDVLQLLHRAELLGDLDGDALGVLVEGARGHRGAVRLQRVGDAGRGQAGLGELLVVQLDGDLLLPHAGDVDAAHAADFGQLGYDDVVEPLGQLVLVEGGGDGEDDSGDLVAAARDHLGIDVLGEGALDPVDRLVDVGARLVEV